MTDDGTVYVADTGVDRIRRITPDGRIATAAGGGSPASGIGDGARAVDASLDRPTDVAFDQAGTLLIADADHGRVRSVTPTGLIDTLAGTGGSGSSGDDGPATSAQIGQPTAVAAGRDGSVYVADRIHHTVRRIAPDGTIVRHAGTGTSGGEGDGGAPQQAQLSFPQALAVAPDASLLIGDAGNGRVRRAALGLPGFTDADFSLPSEDGTVVYQFNRTGRHLRTVDALTGTTRYSFGYDSAGRLTSITEKTGAAAGDVLVTTITRDSAGKATGIVAPGAGSAARPQDDPRDQRRRLARLGDQPGRRADRPRLRRRRAADHVHRPAGPHRRTSPTRPPPACSPPTRTGPARRPPTPARGPRPARGSRAPPRPAASRATRPPSRRTAARGRRSPSRPAPRR